MEQIDDGVWSLEQPFSGTMPFTLAYLIADVDGGISIVDPGERTDENLERLEIACARLGRSLADIRQVIGTHLHRDHVALVDELRAATGCAAVLGAADWQVLQSLGSGDADTEWLRQFAEWGVPAGTQEALSDLHAHAVPLVTAPERLLADGDTIDLPGRRLRVIATPGHTPGHICLWDPGAGLLFTGDHMLPVTYSGLGLGGTFASGAVADYLDSLALVAQMPARLALPGHEAPFADVAGRAAELSRHQLQRTEEVARAQAAGLESVWAIAATLSWSPGWENLHGFHLRSALAQTAMHIELIRRRGRVAAGTR